MEKTKVRQSNIELLRIVAIFLVMVAHCNSWLGGGLPNPSEGMTTVFFGKYIIAALASICVVLFVLISGYFSIKPNLKSIVNLWTQIFFVYIYLFVIQSIVINKGVDVKGLMMCFLAFSRGNWFVKAYLVLMLLSPALNLLAEKLSRKGMLLFLGIFTAMAFVWGCVFHADAAGFNKGYSPLSFAYFYMVGRYLKLHVKDNKSKWFYLIGYLMFSTVIFVGLIAKQKWILYYCNPILVLSAVSLFMFFVKLNIGYVGFINWVASSVFAVFIFHTREPIIGWLEDFNLQKLHSLPYFEYLGLMFVVLVAIFIVAVLMDKLRALIFKPVIDFASRIIISTDENEKFISIKKQ